MIESYFTKKIRIMGCQGFWVVWALLATANLVVSPPVVHPNSQPQANDTAWNLGLHYEKYLQEVIRVLEEDGEFKGKLERAKIEDITSGKISEELQFVNHRVRTQLDELKRVEIDRLRRTLKEQAKLADGRFGDNQRRMSEYLPDHIDALNPHTFEIEDLKKLVMQTTKDLEEVDRKRRDEFKGYELEKEHQRRESLQKLDEENRKKAEQEHEEQLKKHKEHPKLHHPGSKQQLEEVWEEADDMPVEDFEPKTFHNMHDVNGDGYWDYEELSALFIKELNKMYDSKNPEDDMHERYEEMNRMREHVMNETDVNQDGMISLKEFMEMTKRRDFDEDPGWQGIDEQQTFNEVEFQEYEKHRMNPHAGAMPPGGYVPEGAHPGAEYQHVAQQQQFQQMPPHMQPQNHGYPIEPGHQFQEQQNLHPPQGYQQHPQQGFQQPQQGFQQPQQGFRQPPQGYQQHPQGFQQQQPPQVYQQHPQGFQQAPQGFQQAQQQPPQGYQHQIPSQQQQPPLADVNKQPQVVAEKKPAIPNQQLPPQVPEQIATSGGGDQQEQVQLSGGGAGQAAAKPEVKPPAAAKEQPPIVATGARQQHATS